jgi:hypothetical protein
VFVFVYHDYIYKSLASIDECLPIFVNRFVYPILAYGYMRERIIFNNSLASFQSLNQKSMNIDQVYLDLSIENERQLFELKQEKPSILRNILDFMITADSTEFCAKVFSSAIEDQVENDAVDITNKYSSNLMQ